MAWPTPDLDGLLLTDNSNGRRWLHALCRAVNEREGCLGFTKTEFVKADGTEAADITFDDLEGGWIGGTNDCAITNLNRCMAALKAMLTHRPDPVLTGPAYLFNTFKDGSGSSATDWTLSSLQTDIGLGAFPDETPDWASLNFWKQMKEALDRMIYGRRAMGKTSATCTVKAEAAWPPTTGAGSAYPTNFPLEGEITWHWDGSFGITRTAATIYFDCSTMAGTLTESYLNTVKAKSGTWAADPAYTLGGITIPSSEPGGLQQQTTSDITIGSNNSLAFDFNTTPPGSALSGGSWWQGMSVYYADLYIDLSPELTDQA